MTNEPRPSLESVEGAAPPIRILGQYTKDLSFEVPGAPQIFDVLAEVPTTLSVGVTVQTQHRTESTYEVLLQFQVNASAGEHTAFLLELTYGCAVILDEATIPREHIHPVLNIEVPRLLFPFARQIIAEVCAQGGFPRLLLQVVDFGELYAKRYGIPVNAGRDSGETPRTLN